MDLVRSGWAVAPGEPGSSAQNALTGRMTAGTEVMCEMICPGHEPPKTGR
jgi:hypothetical protein